ncbi:MAG: LPS export ABC transporter periplasmic protein LptC [Chlorobiaceae bacterium]|nr:LPS export ABC transporter periplasmic protein LptC [Chlorobiaceae bacterium]NTV61251.1 LPS export ABC transporter periplasmic protein LptC [Chlorobiaceae bacterium]
MAAAAGCGDPPKGRRSPDKTIFETGNPVQEIWAIRLVLTKSGVKRVRIEAGHGSEYKTADGVEHLLDSGIKATFFDGNGTLTTTVTAAKAKVHENHDIEIVGNVTLVSRGNTVMRTDYARWTAKDSMIRSGSPVSISRPGEIIRGRGFETDQALTRYRIFQGSGEAVINK